MKANPTVRIQALSDMSDFTSLLKEWFMHIQIQMINWKPNIELNIDTLPVKNRIIACVPHILDSCMYAWRAIPVQEPRFL